ncbi:MAG TPA: ParB/RepB/Spo0J family partition protein, partial [Roseiflexaceae bacterium]|nr:ParB/RepB/Spo0J family partition protein [Roseiflexaceae bacterium]
AAAGRLRARGWMLFQTGANWRLWAEGVAEPVVLLTDAGLLLVEGWVAQEPDLPIAEIHERVRVESERLRAEEKAGRVASLTKLETEAELFRGLEREAADLGLTLEAGDFGEQLGLCWRYRLTGPERIDLFAELNPIRHRLATWRTEGDGVAVTPGVTATGAVEVEPADDLSTIGQPSTWRPGPDAAGVFRRPPGMPARLEVDPASLVVGRWQPRQTMNDDELESLAQQLRDLGQLDDLLVLVNEQGRLEVIAGHRRRAAALRIGLMLWVKVMEVGLLQADTIAITSNDQRVDLTDLERGRHYRTMQERHHLSVAELARQVGATRTVVSQRLMLTTLAPEVQAALERERLTFSQARGLHEGSEGDHTAQRAALEQLLAMLEAGERATEAAAKALARAQCVGEAPAAGEAAAADQALEEPPAEVPVATDEASAPLVETCTAADEPPAGAAEDLPAQLTRLGCVLVEPVPGWLAIENRLSEEIARRPAEQRAELVVAAAHQLLLHEATGYSLVVEERAADTYQLYKGGYGALTPPLSVLEALEWLNGAQAQLVQEGRFDRVRWDQLGRLGVALGVAATVDWLDAELPGYGLVVHPALPDGVPLTLPESIEQLRIAAARLALAQLPTATPDDLVALRDRAEALGAIVSACGASLDLLAPAWSMDQKVGIKPDALAKQVSTWEREARTLVGLPVEQAHQPGGAPAEEAAPAEQGEEPAPVLVVEDAELYQLAWASCSIEQRYLKSGRIAKPFSYQGKLWIDIGGGSDGGKPYAQRWCVRVVPAGTPYVPGLPLFREGAFCGQQASHEGILYVLTGQFMEVRRPHKQAIVSEPPAAEHDQATTSPMPSWATTPRAAAPWRTLQTARTPGEALLPALQLATELAEELGPSQVDALAPDEATLEGWLQLSERLRVAVEALRQQRPA